MKMEYFYNESGDIKVIDENGNFKWLPQVLVDNLHLMKRNKFTIVTKPNLSVFEENYNVAEAGEAKKRGRPPLNK